jgi:hypothetical protein
VQGWSTFVGVSTILIQSAACKSGRIAAPALSNADITSGASTDTGDAAVGTGADGKQETLIIRGGGQVWQNPSPLEWDPAHFRLFVGNLAGEVTDEFLLEAFSKYPSVQKAKVVRDKRTMKSKGFGFISFSDGEDYFQAAGDMQGNSTAKCKSCT